MRVSGLGDCGTDPCTMFDWVWVRDPCLQYLACADPTDPRYVGATEGLFAAIGSGAGEAVGSAVGGAVSGVGTGISNTLSSPSGATGGITLVGLGVVAVALLLLLRR